MRRLLVVLAAAFAAATMVTGASATAPTFVGLYGCDGDTVIVAANTPITVMGASWGTATRGLVQAFYQAETTTASIDGSAIADPESYWTTPFANPADDQGTGIAPWETNWVYETTPLAPGESMDITVTLTFNHPLPDPIEAMRHRDKPDHQPAGVYSSWWCTLKAES